MRSWAAANAKMTFERRATGGGEGPEGALQTCGFIGRIKRAALFVSGTSQL